MADHVRKQIRDAVLVLLKGNTTAGSYVRLVDAVPTDQQDLPVIVIYSAEETAGLDDATMGPGRSFGRKLELIIEIQANGLAVENTLDLIAAEVETLMGADPTLGGLAKDSWLDDTTTEHEGENKTLIGIQALRYMIDYRTVQGAPTVAA